MHEQPKCVNCVGVHKSTHRIVHNVACAIGALEVGRAKRRRALRMLLVRRALLRSCALKEGRAVDFFGSAG